MCVCVSSIFIFNHSHLAALKMIYTPISVNYTVLARFHMYIYCHTYITNIRIIHSQWLAWLGLAEWEPNRLSISFILSTSFSFFPSHAHTHTSSKLPNTKYIHFNICISKCYCCYYYNFNFINCCSVFAYDFFGCSVLVSIAVVVVIVVAAAAVVMFPLYWFFVLSLPFWWFSLRIHRAHSERASEWVYVHILRFSVCGKEILLFLCVLCVCRWAYVHAYKPYTSHPYINGVYVLRVRIIYSRTCNTMAWTFLSFANKFTFHSAAFLLTLARTQHSPIK